MPHPTFPNLTVLEHPLIQHNLSILRDKSTPLDLQAEVHTRADKNTVEMRRVLADLVARGV